MKWEFGKRNWKADKSKVEVVMDWMSLKLLGLQFRWFSKRYTLKAIMDRALKGVIISIFSTQFQYFLKLLLPLSSYRLCPDYLPRLLLH